MQHKMATTNHDARVHTHTCTHAPEGVRQDVLSQVLNLGLVRLAGKGALDALPGVNANVQLVVDAVEQPEGPRERTIAKR